MQFPPTPPDEHQPHARAVTTSPNLAGIATSLLTPEQTPPSMLAVPRPSLSHHSSSAADSFKTARETASASPLPFHEHVRSDTTKLDLADVSSIPVQELGLPEYNNIMDDTQQRSDAQPVGHVHPLQIRKKRAKRQTPLSQKPLTAELQSTDAHGTTKDWNDLPPDMIVNNTVYTQIRHSKMDRFEAIQDGNAIEAMVIDAVDTRSRALRHVKKHHSLRSDSEHRSISLNHLPKHDKNNFQPDRRSVSTGDVRSDHLLKRQKAFKPRQASTTSTIATEALSNTSTQSARTLRHERRPLSADGRPHTSTVTIKSAPFSPPLRGTGHVRQESTKSAAVVPALLDLGLPELKSTELLPTNALSNAGYSPSLKSHRWTNTQTPLSNMSDRTEMELCEAKNVTLFPHSNESVLLVNSASLPAKQTMTMDDQLAPRTFRPLSFTFEDPESSLTSSSSVSRRDLSTPEIQLNGNIHGVESPLTNPRAPPIPPAIKFIPPTPSNDPDEPRMASKAVETPTRPTPQRQGSLLRTARRLSDSIIQPLFPRSMSTDRSRSLQPAQTQDPYGNRLHPMWTPNYIWNDEDDEYDDEDEDVFYDDYEPLPPGGDTSAHPAERSLFPRSMSVRMPGFRGTGGFLVGNSLGVERHGTNKRRHHIVIPAKRNSRVHFTLFHAMKMRMQRFKLARETAAREKRRAQLKNKIGMRVVHNV